MDLQMDIYNCHLWKEDMAVMKKPYMKAPHTSRSGKAIAKATITVESSTVSGVW